MKNNITLFVVVHNSNIVDEFKVISHTEKSVTYRKSNGVVLTERKNAGWVKWFNTLPEAVDYVLKPRIDELDRLKRREEVLKEEIAEIKGRYL